MTVHLDVLSGMAAKVVDNAEAGKRPSPNDMTEMLYPLQRARQFLQQYPRQSERESYRLFRAMLDRYQALAAAIDNARTDPVRWAAFQQQLPGDARELEASMLATRQALQRGA